MLDIMQLGSGHVLSFERNEEVYHMTREDDDESIVRKLYTLTTCPDEENCSWQSWRKHQPWSFLSKDHCLNYVAHHLKVSGKHQWTDMQIYTKLFEVEDTIECKEFEDTFDQREEYRKQMEQLTIKKRKYEAHGRAVKGRGEGKRGG